MEKDIIDDDIIDNDIIKTLFGDRIGNSIFTPASKVSNMIDLIPIDFWSSTDNKLLDICVKSGRFLKCAYDKFFEHTRHNYKSDEECRQNILNKQLFGICSDKMSVLIANRLLYGSIEVDRNIKYYIEYEKDIKANKQNYNFDKLKESNTYINIKNLFKDVFQEDTDMKFDCVVGNPPYNSGMDLDFVKMAFELSSQYTVMIIPAKWQTAEANQKINSKTINYGQFREELVPHMSTVVFYPDSFDIFNIVENCGITYFIMDKNNNDVCTVRNISNRAKLLNSCTVRDIRKGQSLCNAVNSIAGYIGLDGTNGFNIESLNKEGKYTLYCGVYINYGEFTDSSNGDGGKVKRIFTEDGNLPVTQLNTISQDKVAPYKSYKAIFAYDNENVVKSMQSVIDSKLVRFMMLFQITRYQNVFNNNTFKFVPVLPATESDNPWNHVYTDEELYKAFNLPQEYIDVVESVIKERK